MTLASTSNNLKITPFQSSQNASELVSDVRLSLQENCQSSSGSALDWAPSITASLEEISRNCSVTNWDGEDARAISSKVISITENVARSLYEILPNGTPNPDLLPEADGEICLSWELGDGRIFSLSLGEHNKMNYAGQLGRKGAVHGWQPIDISNPWSFHTALKDIALYIIKLYSL
jgi:hypothetical protein